MATMHYLFYGILSVAVFLLGGISHRAIETEIAVDQPRSRHKDRIENLRERILHIAVQEIGVREATNNNDGQRVEEYLAYTGLEKGHAWCAAFVSWCYGQAGASVPRNAWSSALFPKTRRYTGQQIKQGYVQPADLFAIYNQRLGRIDHVGIVREINTHWVLTVEGNVNNRVLSKRRPLPTIYAFSNWLH